MKIKIISTFKKIFQHELVSGSTYYFLGSMAGNVFAFLFNLFVARKLAPLDYGIYASLLSFFSISILIPQSFLATIVQFATKYFSVNEIDKAKKLYWQTMIFLSLLGFIIFICIIFSAQFIGTFLHVSNIWLIISIAILIVTSFITSVNTAYLQSLLKFGFLSFIQALGSAVKLASGIILVFLGFKIFGALGAVLLSFLVPFFISFIRLDFLLTPSRTSVKVNLKEMVKYALPSMITVIALSSFISTDVILAKHFLPGLEAGLYAGLSLVGKVIFYFTGIIPTVMFPVLIKKHTRGHTVNNTFYLGLLLVGVPSLLITGFYFLFPKFIITFFLGGKDYLHATSNIGLMALYISFFSTITVLANFFLSLKQTKIVFPVVAMAVLQVALIFNFHSSIAQIILDSLIATGGLIILLGLYYIYHQNIAKTYVPDQTFSQEIRDFI